jgi:DNA-binding NarL/FixJ family response regulator
MQRLVIIEDQAGLRERMVEILTSERTYRIVGQCGDGQEGVRMCLKLRPDMVVLDAKLAVQGGVDVLRMLAEASPPPRVLVFSAHGNPVVGRERLKSGAQAFVKASIGLQDFRKGLATLAAGGTYFGSDTAKLPGTAGPGPEFRKARDLLSVREREILKLVAEGNSSNEIASRLGLSPKTVGNHRTNLMRKLNLHDVASLTRQAMELGLLEGSKRP